MWVSIRCPIIPNPMMATLIVICLALPVPVLPATYQHKGLHRPVAGRIALYAGCFLHPSTRMLSNLTCFSRLSVFILKLCHKTRPVQRLAVSDAYALTELIQWVWRSRVRRGEPIILYLPSPRMRRLFEEWLVG